MFLKQIQTKTTCDVGKKPFAPETYLRQSYLVLREVVSSGNTYVEIETWSFFSTLESTCWILGGRVAEKHIPCHCPFILDGIALNTFRISGRKPASSILSASSFSESALPP